MSLEREKSDPKSLLKENLANIPLENLETKMTAVKECVQHKYFEKP